jgi:hypothetical protein
LQEGVYGGYGQGDYMKDGTNALLPLIQQLANCQSRDSERLRKSIEDWWDALRTKKFSELGQAKRAAITAVIINGCPDSILERPEKQELLRLADLVLQRFEERANPKNKVGHLIADVLKEI